MKTFLSILILIPSISFVSAAQATFFGTPVPVGIDTDRSAVGQSLSADELTIFFCQLDDFNNWDMFYATRADRNLSFGSPVPLTFANTSEGEWAPEISADGLSLYFARGIDWQGDLFVSTRQSLSDPFGIPQPLSELNTSEQEMGPSISADELTLHFVYRGDIYVATRSDTSSPFGTPVGLAEINTEEYETTPATSPDQLDFYFTYRAGPDPHDQRVWMASRDDTSSPFADPHRIEEIYIEGVEMGDPYVTRDGSRLYYYSLAEGSLPGDLWMAHLVPEPSVLVMIGAGIMAAVARMRRKE